MIKAYAKSDVGKAREINEDSFYEEFNQGIIIF